MRCSRCVRPPVQALDGRYANGRRIADLRCERHATAADEIGCRLTYLPTGSTYRLEAIRSLAVSA